MANKLVEYKAIFLNCYEEELLLVQESDKKYIEELMSIWFTNFQIHSLGEPGSMARLASSIFTQAATAQFVINLTNRFIINISGDVELGYANLCHIVTSWCGDISTIGTEHSLIPKEIPREAAEFLVGDLNLVASLLKVNRFLIVPIMTQLTLPVSVVTGKSQ